MVCYKNTGNHGAALAVYRRCKKNLFTILEIEPSPETEAVYKSLK